ncbi:MAG TPA: hypothetical protein ENK34_13750 [Rhodobacteraceae bacterium]|nr:hypothetical protein [Paracoccaceae bacterium]
MAFDDKSEIIAHFIGIFNTNTEAARLRSDYDKFRAEVKKTDGPNDLMNVNVKVTSPYAETGFQPGLNINNYSYSAQLNVAAPAHSLQDAGVKALNIQKIALGTLPDLPLDSQIGGFGVYSFTYFLHPPSSVATINIQQNLLVDDDVFANVDLGVGFVNPAAFHAAVNALANTAETLQIVQIPDLPENGDAIAQNALATVEVLSNATDPEMEGATIDLAHGQDAVGIVENGNSTDEVSNLKDAMPEVKQTPEDVVTGDDTPGHVVNTGGSTMVNQAVVTTNWLDAPVIAVMGDYVSVSAVGQVNVWNDTDTANIAAGSVISSTTHGLNSSTITTVANAVAESGYTGGPETVIVTRIEGDVINVNYIQQYNFAYDNDVVSVTFSATETYLELSDNTLINLADLVELGFQYDLIVIGGDMIDLRVISQTNVMLDTDSIHVEGSFSGNIDGSDNLLWNEALIYQSGVNTIEDMTDSYADTAMMLESGSDNVDDGVLNDEAMDGTQVLRVLYIEGDLLDVQAIEQVNVLGDADQVALASETVQSEDGANIEVITGSNALINVASIIDLGIDSTIYVGGDQYSDAMLYQAGFVSTEDPLVVSDTSGLASEAVLFLADDMIDAPQTGNDADMAPVISNEPPADVMQSVLA